MSDVHQLQEIISDKDQKIKRYEKRLHDVVVAFKNLQKEKSALEETLKQVQFTNSKHLTPNSEASTENSTADCDTASSSDATSTASAAAITDYKQRIEKLISSVNELTKQKQEMQASYQNDKRQIREEYERRLAEQKRNLDSCSIVRRDHEAQIAELRNRLKQQRRENEQADQNYSAMLKELQGLVAQEKEARHSAEATASELEMELMKSRSELDQLRRSSSSQQTVTRQLDSEHKRRIEQLESAHRQQVGQLEFGHREEVVKLERAIEQRDAQLAELTLKHEGKVAGFEQQLAALSDSLGAAERQRSADLEHIQRLKDRIELLEQENAQHLQLAASDEAAESAAGSQQPIAVVEPLQRAAAAAAEVAGTQVGESAAAEDSNSSERLHANCREELQLLRAEFDAYKERAQALISRARSPGQQQQQPRGQLHNEELQRLQRDLFNCRDRNQALEAELQQLEAARSRKEAALMQKLTSMQQRHEEELQRQRLSLEARIVEAEEELRRQRDRGLSLLAEKDSEIQHLRCKLTAGRGGLLKHSADPADSELSLDKLHTNSVNCPSLHSSNEQSLAQREAAALREAKRTAEQSLRSVQAELTDLRHQVGDLRAELARARQPGSQSAEYVRNLVFKYLTLADDCTARKTMINAICTVLHYSDSERNRIIKKQLPSSSWW